MIIGAYAFMAILILILTPTVFKVYERCYYPVLRVPYTEISFNALALIIGSLSTTILYAITGGAIISLITPHKINITDIQYGTTIGAITFFTGRYWALHRSHSFAQSILFFGVLVGASCIAFFFFYPKYSTVLTDNILKVREDRTDILAYMFGFSFLAVVLSEVIAKFSDFFVGSNALISYSLVRQQLEHFERYIRIRNEKQFERMVNEEIDLAIHNSHGKSTSISWLTSNAYDPVKKILLQKMTDQPGNINCKIISHDTEKNKFDLKFFVQDDIKYVPLDGTLRLFIIGNRIAFLGIQMGINRHAHFPDYVMIIRNKVRISENYNGDFITVGKQMNQM